MAASASSSEPQGISRREAIRRAALLAGVAIAPGWLAIVDRTAVSAQAGALSAEQRALVGAMADRILPRTDTPGASDVGVPAFIDLLYGQFMTTAEQERLRTGLQAVEAASLSAHNTGFTALAGDRQDDLLRSIARTEEAADTPDGFFRFFRSAVILGYFSSEEVGRNVLHYDPIPGRYESCVPLSDVGNRNWTT